MNAYAYANLTLFCVSAKKMLYFLQNKILWTWVNFIVLTIKLTHSSECLLLCSTQSHTGLEWHGVRKLWNLFFLRLTLCNTHKYILEMLVYISQHYWGIFNQNNHQTSNRKLLSGWTILKVWERCLMKQIMKSLRCLCKVLSCFEMICHSGIE